MQNKSLILRSPDEDPLAMPAGSVNTDYPLLKSGGIVRFEVQKMELVDAKSEEAPEGAKNLKISLATAGEERSMSGEVLHKGHVTSKYIPLYESGKYTKEDMRRNVATFIQAIYGKEGAKAVPMAAVRDENKYEELFIGRPIDAKVGIQEDKTGAYGPSNTLRFIVPGDTK